MIANIAIDHNLKDIDHTLVRFAGDVLPKGWHAALDALPNHAGSHGTHSHGTHYSMICC